jgi:hypothetical protein
MISLEDQIRCAARELKIRQSVYPRWVRTRRMKQGTAEEEIARMAAVGPCRCHNRPARRSTPSMPGVATEPDGGEGVSSAQLGDIHMPLVDADIDRMKSLRLWAELARKATGYPVRLVRFAHREDLEDL